MHMAKRDEWGEPRRMVCKINHATNNKILGEVAGTHDPAEVTAPVEAFCPKCFYLLTASQRAQVKMAGLEISQD